MVFRSFSAIQILWPKAKPKDLRPFLKNEITVLQISPLKKPEFPSMYSLFPINPILIRGKNSGNGGQALGVIHILKH